MKTRRRSPPASSRYWVTAAWCSATTDEVVSMERRQRPFGRIRSCPPRSHATASVRRGRARHARFSGERSSRSDRQPAATRFRVRPDAIAPVAAGLGCVSAWSRPAPTCAFTQVGSYGSLLRSREGERRTSRRVIAGCSEIADSRARAELGEADDLHMQSRFWFPRRDPPGSRGVSTAVRAVWSNDAAEPTVSDARLRGRPGCTAALPAAPRRDGLCV
jgi:hypothetical protein